MRSKAFKLKRYLLLSIVACMALGGTAHAQSDTNRVTALDSITYGGVYLAKAWNYFTHHVGGDVFAQGEIYTFHFSKSRFFSGSGGFGLGAEFRVAPVFIGGTIGESGNEIPRPPSDFYYSSLYVGFMIYGYRIELGDVYGGTSSWSTHPPPLAVYKSYFAGIGKRYGSGFFFEPEIKVMFPDISTFYYYQNLPGVAYGEPYGHIAVGTDKSALRDMFFAFTVRLGLGFGNEH